MPRKNQIDGVKIRQVLTLVFIISLVGVIVYNLSQFIPSFLGALTLYIICRNYYFKLIKNKGWKSWIAAVYIMLITIVVILVSSYFIGDAIVTRLIHIPDYLDDFNNFFTKIHRFIFSELGVDLLSTKNIEKIGTYVASVSSTIVITTIDVVVAIGAAYFILFFMFVNAQEFEDALREFFPMKKSDISLVGEKIRKLVVANAVGIPVVALVQGVVGLSGYWIFGAPDPWLLFALTCIGSMLPVVGAAIVYVPVSIFMMATGDLFGGIGIMLYGFIVIGIADNVFRFVFLKKLENIHPLNTVFGIILGLNVFGVMGLIFGPILISLTVLLVRIYKNEFSEEENEFSISYEDSGSNDK